jgi:hypothetical protein
LNLTLLPLLLWLPVIAAAAAPLRGMLRVPATLLLLLLLLPLLPDTADALLPQAA